MSLLLSTLADVVAALDRVGISHMAVGSVASTYYGEPRTTQDIDIVIDPTAEQLEMLVDQVDRERYYVGDAAAAFGDRSQFNVVDLNTGFKVDLIVKRDREFSRTEFDRRQRVELGGVQVHLATPEDTILAKLEWAALGESERQIRDVEAMVRLLGDRLDTEYLRTWADELGIVDALERVLSEGPSRS